jgi:hypothetical protein
MDVERPHQKLTETDVDHVLQAALNVGPSPQFLAQVRARVARESMTSLWNSSFAAVATAAVGVAATVAIIAFVKHRPEQDSFPRSATTSFSDTNGSTGSVAMPPTAESASTERAAESSPPETAAPPGSDRPGRQAGAEAGPAREDLLLSARDSEAFRILLDAARAGRITVAPPVADALFASVTPQSFEAIPVPAITIPPITIEPLRPVSQ